MLILLTAASTGAGQASPAAAAQFPLLVLQWFVAVSAAPSVPPIWAEDRVYVALRSGVIVAHQASGGARLWSVDLVADQPLAADEAHVFVASGEAVHALQGASGQESWRAASGPVTAPPLAQAGWLVVAAGDALTAFRASDGTRVWRQEVGAVQEPPFIDGNVLYASLTDGRIVALDVQSGESRWERRLPVPTGEPFVYGDRLYVGSGDKYLNCLETAGGSVDWRIRIGAEVRGRPAADAERVYIAALDNQIRALDRGSGAIRWRRGVPFRPSAGPVVFGATIGVSGPVAEFRIFNAADGQPVKAFHFAEPVVTAPAVRADGEPVRLRIAAVIGGLKNEWQLTVFGPAGEVPEGPPLLPLTELPGVVIQQEL